MMTTYNWLCFDKPIILLQANCMYFIDICEKKILQFFLQAICMYFIDFCEKKFFCGNRF